MASIQLYPRCFPVSLRGKKIIHYRLSAHTQYNVFLEDFDLSERAIVKIWIEARYLDPTETVLVYDSIVPINCHKNVVTSEQKYRKEIIDGVVIPVIFNFDIDAGFSESRLGCTNHYGIQVSVGDRIWVSPNLNVRCDYPEKRSVLERELEDESERKIARINYSIVSFSSVRTDDREIDPVYESKVMSGFMY